MWKNGYESKLLSTIITCNKQFFCFLKQGKLFGPIVLSRDGEYRKFEIQSVIEDTHQGSMEELAMFVCSLVAHRCFLMAYNCCTFL